MVVKRHSRIDCGWKRSLKKVLWILTSGRFGGPFFVLSTKRKEKILPCAQTNFLLKELMSHFTMLRCLKVFKNLCIPLGLVWMSFIFSSLCDHLFVLTAIDNWVGGINSLPVPWLHHLRNHQACLSCKLNRKSI